MYKEIMDNTNRIYNNSNKSEEYISLVVEITNIHKEIGEVLLKFNSIYKTRKFYENEIYYSTRYSDRISILKKRLQIKYKTLEIYDKLNRIKDINSIDNIIEENVNENNKYIDLLKEYSKEQLLTDNKLDLANLIAIFNDIFITRTYTDESYIEYEHRSVLDNKENEEEMYDPRSIRVLISDELNKEETNNELKNIFSKITQIDEYENIKIK